MRRLAVDDFLETAARSDGPRAPLIEERSFIAAIDDACVKALLWLWGGYCASQAVDSFFVADESTFLAADGVTDGSDRSRVVERRAR